MRLDRSPSWGTRQQRAASPRCLRLVGRGARTPCRKRTREVAAASRSLLASRAEPPSAVGRLPATTDVLQRDPPQEERAESARRKRGKFRYAGEADMAHIAI